MNDWMDDRLASQKLRLGIIRKACIDGRETLGDYKRGCGLHWTELVMSHLDVAPRNLMLLRDGSVCLLDWAFAGFDLPIFEFSTLHVRIEWSE